MSEVLVRPPTDLLPDESAPAADVAARSRARARSSVPAPLLVRFKDADLADGHLTSPPMIQDEPSFFDTDASQFSALPPRPKRRRAVARISTTYIVARPAPTLAVKKALLSTVRPRLVLQLQELAVGQRPVPAIDVFPASLIAGPLARARYIHRFPRMLGNKREWGPRDLILLRSEDYASDVDADGDNAEISHARREPVAVLGPGRGSGEAGGEIVLDDGSSWTCSNQRSFFDFVHVDSSGSSLTARWVRRPVAKRISSAPAARPVSLALSPQPFPSGSEEVPEADFCYTFSIINPLSRRHPVLATLTRNSMQIYHDYTTPSLPSAVQSPCPPVSGALDSASSLDSPSSPLIPQDEVPVERQSYSVDEDTRKLIKVTGLWLILQLDLRSGIESTQTTSCTPHESPTIMQPSTFSSALPRRQTASAADSISPPQTQTYLRRAMSTGAAFIHRRRQKELSAIQDGGTVVISKMLDKGSGETEQSASTVPSAAVEKTPAYLVPSRRTSWLKRLTH